MKYIKTFEKLITLDLEQKELNLLMSDALSNNNLTVIRSLLENGYMLGQFVSCKRNLLLCWCGDGEFTFVESAQREPGICEG